MIDWLLDFAPMLPLVGFFWGPCGCCESTPCEPCTEGDYIVTLEQYGSGWIILISDDDVLAGGAGDTGNTAFWENVLALIGGGTIGCAGDPDYWTGFDGLYWGGIANGTVPGIWPTVEITSDADFASVSAVFVGYRQSTPSFGPQYALLPETLTVSTIADWIDGGGVLILVAEAESTEEWQGLAVQTTHNLMLDNLAACSRFLYGDHGFGESCGLGGCVGDTNPSSPLIDGTFGTANPEVRYAKPLSYCCGPTWVMRRGSEGGTFAAAEFDPGDCDACGNG